MSFGLHTASLVLLFICFVFLLLSTISAPIVEAFPLGKTANYVYGTFGYCTGGKCSSVGYPWDYPADSSNNWILSASTRSSMNKIVILIPITLGLTFFNLISVIVLHFKNKLKVISIVLNLLVLLCLIILSIILILIYYPNVGWMTWCLLACAILAIVSFIILIISTFTSSKYSVDEDSDLTSLNNQYINNNFNEKFSNINANNISLPHTRQDNSHDDEAGFKVKAPLIISPNYNNSNINANRSNTMTNTSEYNAHPPTQTNDFINKPMAANYASKNSSYYSHNDDKVSVINSVGTPVNSNKQMAPTIVANVATRSSIDDVPGSGYDNDTNGNGGRSNYHHQTPYPTNSVSYDQSVFQHHPEVEGHKPFTELDDFEVDDELANTNHNGLVNNLQLSDSESDFTSVSQRGYNYNSNNIQYPHVQQFIPSNQQFSQNEMNDDVPPPPPPHQQSYNNRVYAPSNGRQSNQGFQQAPAAAPVQQSRSDGLLNDNPDFNIVGPSKRKQNSGFVPVAARYKNQLVPGGGRPGNGTGSNTGSGPYSIAR